MGFAQAAALRAFLSKLCVPFCLRVCLRGAVVLVFLRRFAFRGVPQSPPRDLPGQPWGKQWRGGGIFRHFGQPFCIHLNRLAHGATKGPPLAFPVRAHVSTFASISAVRARSKSLLGSGCLAGGPREAKCGFDLVNTDVL